MLIDLLFKEYRKKVLSLLLLAPAQRFHVQEIARLTDTAAGTLHKELKLLAESGLLIRNQQGNQVLYQANTDCLIFPELASILRKTTGFSVSLTETLSPRDDIRCAFVFGSMAQDTAHAGSDIDLLVVGTIGFTDLIALLYPLQEQLGREINPKLYAPDEWSTKASGEDGFITEILTKPKIFVKGCNDDIGQSAGH